MSEVGTLLASCFLTNGRIINMLVNKCHLITKTLTQATVYQLTLLIGKVTMDPDGWFLSLNSIILSL